MIRPAALALVLITSGPAILSCQRADRTPNRAASASLIETRWTDATAKETAMLSKEGKIAYDLPQLIVYNGSRQLVYVLNTRKPWSPTAIGSEIDKAIAAGQRVAGPPLTKTLGDLETREGRPASSAVAGAGVTLVFDYWASWCVPCKMLEKSLVEWQSTKPAGSVQIVKAETDIMKALRATGEKTYMIRRGSDGKLHKVELLY